VEQKKRLKRIEMIIKMVNEFKPTIIHFARPNPMQISACAWIYCWTKNWKIRTGPVRPSWAMALRVVGCWAAGLLLAKPYQKCSQSIQVQFLLVI